MRLHLHVQFEPAVVRHQTAVVWHDKDVVVVERGPAWVCLGAVVNHNILPRRQVVFADLAFVLIAVQVGVDVQEPVCKHSIVQMVVAGAFCKCDQRRIKLACAVAQYDTGWILQLACAQKHVKLAVVVEVDQFNIERTVVKRLTEHRIVCFLRHEASWVFREITVSVTAKQYEAGTTVAGTVDITGQDVDITIAGDVACRSTMAVAGDWGRCVLVRTVSLAQNDTRLFASPGSHWAKLSAMTRNKHVRLAVIVEVGDQGATRCNAAGSVGQHGAGHVDRLAIDILVEMHNAGWVWFVRIQRHAIGDNNQRQLAGLLEITECNTATGRFAVFGGAGIRRHHFRRNVQRFRIEVRGRFNGQWHAQRRRSHFTAAGTRTGQRELGLTNSRAHSAGAGCRTRRQRVGAHAGRCIRGRPGHHHIVARLGFDRRQRNRGGWRNSSRRRDYRSRTATTTTTCGEGCREENTDCQTCTFHFLLRVSYHVVIIQPSE